MNADFDISIDSIDAKLLYFLNIGLDDIAVQFAAGIFVDMSKEAALRLDEPEDKNTVQYGRLTRDMMNNLASKRDIFQLSASAAAGLTAKEALVDLHTPTSQFNQFKPWLPTLHISVDNSTANAVEAVVRKESGIASTSRRRGRRSLKQQDRRRLDQSISVHSHRALRMLSEEVILDNLDLNCDVDTANGFACARFSDIVLDVSNWRTPEGFAVAAVLLNFLLLFAALRLANCRI